MKGGQDHLARRGRIGDFGCLGTSCVILCIHENHTVFVSDFRSNPSCAIHGPAPAGCEEGSGTDDFLVFVGTYTRQDSKGIYAFRFQPSTGKLTSIGLAAETDNPSFLAVHPNHRFLYAVNEISNFEGQSAGSVSSFSIDGKTGMLTPINKTTTRGTIPAHLVVDKTGKSLVVANYGSGSVAAFPAERGRQHRRRHRHSCNIRVPAPVRGRRGLTRMQ